MARRADRDETFSLTGASARRLRAAVDATRLRGAGRSSSAVRLSYSAMKGME